MTLKLFDSPSGVESWQEQLGPGAVLLRGFAASDETMLLAALQDVIAMAPFCHMVTPCYGTGQNPGVLLYTGVRWRS